MEEFEEFEKEQEIELLPTVQSLKYNEGLDNLINATLREVELAESKSRNKR